MLPPRATATNIPLPYAKLDQFALGKLEPLDQVAPKSILYALVVVLEAIATNFPLPYATLFHVVADGKLLSLQPKPLDLETNALLLPDPPDVITTQ